MRPKIKKQLLNRLRRVEGQIKGLQRMVDKERYCIDVINQSLAAKQALSKVEDLMLENHLSTHVVEQMKGRNEKKAAKEILAVYKLSKKKK